MPEARAQIIIEGIDRFSRVAKSIERGLGGLERSALALSGVGRRLTLGVTMPMAGMGVMAVKTAAKFDTALKAIQAVGGHTEEQIEELGETFIRMSTDIKTTVDSAQTLADAFYLIQGSGFAGAEAMKVLEISTKAATAGLTSTDIAARAVTATLSAYTLGADDARRISDVLFRTVDIGVVSFEELASSIGGVVGSAAAAGVSIEEVGAAIATMTKAGYSGAESVTSLNMVIAAFLKPSEAMEEALKRIGYESGEAFLRTEGLEGALRLLRHEVEKGTVGWEDLFGNVRAYRGAIALTRGEMRPFQEDLEAIRKATEGAGATQKTFNKMVESAEFQMKSLRRQFEAATLELGRALLPAFKDVLSTLTPLIKGFSSLDDGTRSLIVRAGLLGAAFGPVAIGVSKLMEASRTLTSVFGKVTTKMAEKTLALGDQTAAENAARTSTGLLTGKLIALKGALGGASLAAAGLAAGLAGIVGPMVYLTYRFKEQELQARETAKTYDEYLERLGLFFDASGELDSALMGLVDTQVTLGTSLVLTRHEFERLRKTLSDAETDVRKLEKSWVESREELELFTPSLRGFGRTHDLALERMEEDLTSYKELFSSVGASARGEIAVLDTKLAAFKGSHGVAFDAMKTDLEDYRRLFSDVNASALESMRSIFSSLEAGAESHDASVSEMEADLSGYKFAFTETMAWVSEEVAKQDSVLQAFKTSHDLIFEDLETDLGDYISRFIETEVSTEERIRSLDEMLTAFKGSHDSTFSGMETDLNDYLGRFQGLVEGVRIGKDSLSEYIAAMEGYLDALARSFDAASTSAVNLKDSILKVPSRIDSQIYHNFRDAANAAYGVKSAIEAIPSTKTVTIYTRQVGLYPMERGGIVPGPPGRPVPIIAHAGELVLPAQVTRLLLGQRMLRPVRAAREIHFHYEPTFSFATAIEMRNAARELFRLVREEERRLA